jgi:hypothetical protein
MLFLSNWSARAWDYESSKPGFVKVNNFEWLQLQQFSEGFIRFYMKQYGVLGQLSELPSQERHKKSQTKTDSGLAP